MLITCNHCNRQLTLPDDKVPDKAFALTCPGCKGRIQVDPTLADAVDSSGFGFERLAKLREYEQNLMSRLFPVGIVANLAGSPADPLVEALKFLGMDQVDLETDLEKVAEMMRESQVAILLIALDKATAPPCEPLQPIQRLPQDVRRRTFVGLVAPNVRSLDGQTAFYLQMNCLLNAGEVSTIPRNLQRALLFHLRHYRYWDARDEE